MLVSYKSKLEARITFTSRLQLASSCARDVGGRIGRIRTRSGTARRLGIANPTTPGTCILALRNVSDLFWTGIRCGHDWPQDCKDENGRWVVVAVRLHARRKRNITARCEILPLAVIPASNCVGLRTAP